MKKYTKKSFLSELKKRLNLKFSAEDTKDIMLDYSEIFETGMLEGRTEQEIIADLHSPKEIAKELSNQSQNHAKNIISFFKKEMGKSKFTKKYIVIFAILAVLTFFLFTFSVFCTYKIMNFNSWILLFPNPAKIGLLYSALYNLTIIFTCLLWIYEIFLFINFMKIKKTIISFSFINIGVIITTNCFTNLLRRMDDPSKIYDSFIICLYPMLVCLCLAAISVIMLKKIHKFPKNFIDTKIESLPK